MESQRSGSLPDDIMHSQTLQCENDWSQTCPLDFWNRIFRHALLPKRLVIDTKALPGRGPSGSTCSLLSLAPDHTTTEQNCKTNLHRNKLKLHLIPSVTHFDIGTTSRMSMPTLELWLSCFTNPLSMMYLDEEKGWRVKLCREVFQNLRRWIMAPLTLYH